MRHSGSAARRREYTFTDLLTIKQLSAELERGTPLRRFCARCWPSVQGQLELDFVAGQAPTTRRAPRSSASRPKPLAIGRACRRLPASSLPYRVSDPQAALAAKYFIEGSRLDDGDERTMAEAAAGVPARRSSSIPIWCRRSSTSPTSTTRRDELIEAQALYERAIGLDPDCFEAHFNLGNIHHDLGRFDRALVCYRDAVALNPGYPDAHFYLAVTLEKTGHSPEAKPHWKTYQELAPKANGWSWRESFWSEAASRVAGSASTELRA